MKKVVFIHADAIGGRVGNGGFRQLVYFAEAAASIGYEVHLFDHLDRLKWEQFEWLSWGGPFNFDLLAFEDVCRRQEEGVWVTSWLNVLMDGLKLRGGLNAERMRYLESSELVREGFKFQRAFVLGRTKKIAINNRSLVQYYRQMGYGGEIIPVEPWYRKDMFYWDHDQKIPLSVGHQSDNRKLSMVHTIQGQFSPVIVCEGSHMDVAKAMRAADYYVFWNRIPSFIKIFQGETTGDSLFEAMAAGCVCVARKHAGNEFLEPAIKHVTRKKDIVPVMRRLMRNQEETDELRAKGMAIIDMFFRLNEAKQLQVAAFLD